MNDLIFWNHVLNVEIRQRLRRMQIVDLHCVLGVKTSSVPIASLGVGIGANIWNN